MALMMKIVMIFRDKSVVVSGCVVGIDFRLVHLDSFRRHSDELTACAR